MRIFVAFDGSSEHVQITRGREARRTEDMVVIWTGRFWMHEGWGLSGVGQEVVVQRLEELAGQPAQYDALKITLATDPTRPDRRVVSGRMLAWLDNLRGLDRMLRVETERVVAARQVLREWEASEQGRPETRAKVEARKGLLANLRLAEDARRGMEGRVRRLLERSC